MITSKLMSKVLGRDIYSIDNYIECDDFSMNYSDTCEIGYSYFGSDINEDDNIGLPNLTDAVINKYELMHLCEEYCKNNGFIIGVDVDKVSVWSVKERKIVNNFEDYFEDYFEFKIKATQWVIDNKDER